MEVNMMFIPVPGKVYYIQAKAYCAISLQSFMQKIIQKLVTRNRDKTSGHVRYIYNNLPTNQEVHRNRNTSCDYRYTGSSGKQEVTVELY
jgi:hypothetical protein